MSQIYTLKLWETLLWSKCVVVAEVRKTFLRSHILWSNVIAVHWFRPTTGHTLSQTDKSLIEEHSAKKHQSNPNLAILPSRQGQCGHGNTFQIMNIEGKATQNRTCHVELFTSVSVSQLQVLCERNTWKIIPKLSSHFRQTTSSLFYNQALANGVLVRALP